MIVRLCFITLLCALALAAAPAHGDQVLTVTADSTMDGNAGVLLEVEDPPGALAETRFMITQAGKIRVYATRAAGSPAWTVHPVAIYLVPKNNINPGDTWRYLDEPDGSETIAEAIVEESVDTPAGTFLAWRIDVARASNPTKLVRSVWFADDLGTVREVEYFDQWIQWEGLLDMYSVGGNGHFPLSVGNTWSLLTGGVATEASSMSAIKGQFRNQ
jgi:hypothetical protein